jgi:sugar phosphate isomerase/epimerase
MQTAFDRRSFLKATGAAGAAMGLAGLGLPRLAAAEVASRTPHADKLGWRLTNTCYTFNALPLFAAVEKTVALGISRIESFSWQPIGGGLEMNETLPAAARRDVTKRLCDLGVKLVSCYMAELPNDEAAARKKFEFGKDMGLEFFVSEPAPAAMDLMEKLCDEYGLSLAIHNHPRPHSVYWNPAKVVEVTKGRSPRLGACCDTGHWVRSGLKPVDCLKLLSGRIKSFHLKDVTPFGNPGAEEVPWGTGASDIEGILREIRRQNLGPVIAIEYERPGDTMPQLRQCVAFYDQVAAKLQG